MNTKPGIDYDELDMSMHRAQIDAEPAESHGMLTALLCVSPQQDPDSWINDEILYNLSETAEVAECRDRLRALWRQTGRELAGGDYDLHLLLPADDTDLAATRKQIMALINRQHRDVIHNLAKLNHKISENLYSDEFEL